MSKVFISPSKYIQGAGELNNLGKHAASYGKRALALISKSGYERFGKQVEAGFASTGCEVVFEFFHGECCMTEINRLTALAKDKGCDIVIALGEEKFWTPPKP